VPSNRDLTANMKSFSLFSQPAEVWTTACSVIFPLLESGAVKPIVAKTFPLAEAADALRYLVAQPKPSPT
jgi:NADPH2:quinone reductase